jgi:CheY-like chemotaxis protein
MMPYSIHDLSGKTVLVAEDEYMLADAIEAAIRSAGGAVQGPFPSAAEALQFLADTPKLPDAAALNIKLRDGDSYPVADELALRGIPYLFASANSFAALPQRFSRSAMVPKPYAAVQVVQGLTALLSLSDNAI